jgi:hypothetical protein
MNRGRSRKSGWISLRGSLIGGYEKVIENKNRYRYRSTADQLHYHRPFDIKSSFQTMKERVLTTVPSLWVERHTERQRIVVR